MGETSGPGKEVYVLELSGVGMDYDTRIGQLQSDPGPPSAHGCLYSGSASHRAEAPPSPPLTCNFPQPPVPQMHCQLLSTAGIHVQIAWSQAVEVLSPINRQMSLGLGVSVSLR